MTPCGGSRLNSSLTAASWRSGSSDVPGPPDSRIAQNCASSKGHLFRRLEDSTGVFLLVRGGLRVLQHRLQGRLHGVGPDAIALGAQVQEVGHDVAGDGAVVLEE